MKSSDLCDTKNDVVTTCDENSKTSETDKRVRFARNNTMKPRKNTIHFESNCDELSDETYTAKVMNFCGKSKGKYLNSWNVEYLSPDRLKGQLQHMDVFRDVKSWECSDDVPEVLVTLDDDNEAKFEEAKQQELQSWKSYGVYQKFRICSKSSLQRDG